MSKVNPGPGPGSHELSEPERKLFAGVADGTLTDLRTGKAEADDPAAGAKWGDSRQIRAQLLAELLTGTRGSDRTRPRAIKLRGARITGPLNLETAILLCPLLLRDCYLDEPVNLDQASAPAIRMPGCHMPALAATQLHTTGDMELNDKAVVNGEVRLTGAHIGGELNFDGTTLINRKGTALNAHLLTVDQGMSCGEGFTADGEICLDGCRITGGLDMTGASLSNPVGVALSANGLALEGNMYCQDEFTANGEIRLTGTHIHGQLDLSKAILTSINGPALSADQLTVDQAMLCDGFTVNGETRLPSAHIGGQLYMGGASSTLARPA
jgi:hypothetical protein